jgi:hypothetical protein
VIHANSLECFTLHERISLRRGSNNCPKVQSSDARFKGARTHIAVQKLETSSD